MKIKIFLIVVICLLIVAGCTKDTTSIKGPTNEIDIDRLEFFHSEKGWELYSWFDGKAWNYSILEGTNRFKSFEEVTGNKVRVIGEKKLMMVLKKLPKGDSITWIGQGWLARCWGTNYGNLELPSQEIIEKIKQFCAKIDLIIQVTN